MAMSEAKINKPIFVIGMNGSGTTMMLNCLNAHPEIYGFPRETQMIPYYFTKLKEYGDLNDDKNFRALWDEFRSLSCFRWENWRNGGVAPDLPDDWCHQPRSLATVVDQTIGYFARTQGKQRWCEKTPMYAQHIGALHEIFPDACFIHMIRDGRSCSASFHRRWRYVPERTIYRWRNVIQTARQQAQESGARYMEVFYERLTSDPESEMKRVCGFVGVSFQDAVLSPSRKPKHMGSMAEKIVRSAPRWTTYFRTRQVHRLESIAGKMLTELGYETSVADGDRNPSGLVLRYWTLRDYSRRAMGVLWEQISTPKKQKWDNLGGRIRRAIQQKRSSRF